MLPKEFVEHLVAVAGGGEDALGTDPADRGIGAGLEILNPIYNPSSLVTCLLTSYLWMTE